MKKNKKKQKKDAKENRKKDKINVIISYILKYDNMKDEILYPHVYIYSHHSSFFYFYTFLPVLS